MTLPQLMKAVLDALDVDPDDRGPEHLQALEDVLAAHLGRVDVPLPGGRSFEVIVKQVQRPLIDFHQNHQPTAGLVVDPHDQTVKHHGILFQVRPPHPLVKGAGLAVGWPMDDSYLGPAPEASAKASATLLEQMGQALAGLGQRVARGQS